MRRGLFITGTDTGVGKTMVTAMLLKGLNAAGIHTGFMKPVATGARERLNGRWIAADARRLRAASGAGDSWALVNPYAFAPPAAPLVAAQASHQRIAFPRIVRAFQRLSLRYRCVLVEGVGGLLVPLTPRRTVADLAGALQLPLVIVARLGLGTLNHTWLTVEASRRAGLSIAGLVFHAGTRRRPTGLAERTNPAVIRRLTRVPVWGILPTQHHRVVEACRTYLQEVA